MRTSADAGVAVVRGEFPTPLSFGVLREWLGRRRTASRRVVSRSSPLLRPSRPSRLMQRPSRLMQRPSRLMLMQRPSRLMLRPSRLMLMLRPSRLMLRPSRLMQRRILRMHPPNKAPRGAALGGCQAAPLVTLRGGQSPARCGQLPAHSMLSTTSSSDPRLARLNAMTSTTTPSTNTRWMARRGALQGSRRRPDPRRARY